MAAALLLGVRQIHAGARVLAVLLTLETVIILILDVGILVAGPNSGERVFGCNRSRVGGLRRGHRVALMFAHASFIGFEGTRSTARRPRTQTHRAPRHLTPR